MTQMSQVILGNVDEAAQQVAYVCYVTASVITYFYVCLHARLSAAAFIQNKF